MPFLNSLNLKVLVLVDEFRLLIIDFFFFFALFSSVSIVSFIQRNLYDEKKLFIAKIERDRGRVVTFWLFRLLYFLLLSLN